MPNTITSKLRNPRRTIGRFAVVAEFTGRSGKWKFYATFPELIGHRFPVVNIANSGYGFHRPLPEQASTKDLARKRLDDFTESDIKRSFLESKRRVGQRLKDAIDRLQQAAEDQAVYKVGYEVLLQAEIDAGPVEE